MDSNTRSEKSMRKKKRLCVIAVSTLAKIRLTVSTITARQIAAFVKWKSMITVNAVLMTQKCAAKKIKIGAEIDISGLIRATFEYVKEHCTNGKQGEDNACLTGGGRSALTGGDESALTGGDRSALTGGDWSALTGGDRSVLTGGDRSALTGGDRSALTGGNWSALTGGDWSVVYGGYCAKVRAGKRSVLALQYWKNYKFKGIKFKEVDGINIKENTWYKLDSLGRFVEAKEETEKDVKTNT